MTTRRRIPRVKHTKKHHPAIKHTVVVGKIHAHWCTHCQALAPEWKKMKYAIQEKTKHTHYDTRYVFREIEQAEQDGGIAEVNSRFLANSERKLELQGGYPTIYKIRDGKLEYYDGERSYLGMLRWFMGTMPDGKEKPEHLKGGEGIDGKGIEGKGTSSISDMFHTMMGGVKSRKNRRVQGRKGNRKSRSHRKSSGVFSFLWK